MIEGVCVRGLGTVYGRGYTCARVMLGKGGVRARPLGSPPCLHFPDHLNSCLLACLPLTPQVVANLGAADIDARLEEQLVDGLLYAFQEQVADDSPVMLNGFGTLINALGKRAKPYLPQVRGDVAARVYGLWGAACAVG